uniref:Integrase, catalytic region, zinc finger, CCHC-type, peptidase aspartic, catalytic n=1 Tax=Tanacetum cinerariifolium TaxID=118510 RepID=A0A6L2JVL2_TANCI|nr:hypothetical protein [Tanacetum cinerariifolium]
MKTKALKEHDKVAKLVKALMVYPPNTPVKLVPMVLPIKSQVKINIFALIKLFLELEKTCKKRITPTCLIKGERGFEQTKECYLTEVIPFFKTLKEHFGGTQKALTTEIKEMKINFDELEAEVDQNDVNRKCDEIERRNLLIANDTLISNCLSTEVFYIATNSELNVSRNNKKFHLYYLKHLKESVATLREIIKEAKVERALDRSVASACLYTKHSQELLEYVIGTCPKDFSKQDKKQATTPLNRKKQVTFRDQCETSYMNTQKHVEQQITQKTNVSVLPSTEVDSCTDASGSKPMSNTKKNRISPAKSVNKKTVEDHTRTNKSSFQKPNRCSKHMTGDRSRLRNFIKKFIGTVRFGNGHFGAIMGTEYQLADLFAKSLPKERFEYLVYRIGMMIPNAFLTDEIHATDDYAKYEMVFVKKTSLLIKSLKVTIKQKAKTASIPPLLSIALQKTTLIAETQENVAKVQEKMEKEDIEKMVEGEEDEESYASESVDSMLNDDNDDTCTRIEPESHKKNPEVVVVDDDDDVNVTKKKDDKKDNDEEKDDDVEKKDDDKNEKEKKDEKKNDVEDKDNVDHTDHALVGTHATGSLESRNKQMRTPIPTLNRSPRKELSLDKTNSKELTATASPTTTTTSKSKSKRGFTSNKSKILPGSITGMYSVVPELMFAKTYEMIKEEMPRLADLTVKKDREIAPTNVQELISKEFATHAPKIIEELF